MEFSEVSGWDLDRRIAQRPTGCTAPLTALQFRGWSGWIKRGGRSPVLRVCASSNLIEGQLDVVLLQRCIEFVLRRHEALRTRIAIEHGCPVQHVDSPRDYHLEVVDLTRLAPSAAGREVGQLAQRFLDQGLNPFVGPLFESRLWRLPDDKFVFVLAMEHSFADGISYGILNREVWELYFQGARGAPFSLATLEAQFPDYAFWQQQTFRAWKAKHEAYWNQHLSGVKSLKIPPDLGSEVATAPVVISIPFGTSLTAKIRAAARREGTLPSMMVLVIYAVAMARWCDRADLLITYVNHGRYRRPELRNMIGFIANLLYLRIRLAPKDTLRELLKQVQLEISCALEHLDYDRVPDFIPECSSEAFFNWQSTNSSKEALDHHFISESMLVPNWAQRFAAEHSDEKLSISPFYTRWSGLTKFSPIFYDTPDDINLVVTYAPDVMLHATIERLGVNLKSIAAQMSECPLTRMEEISMSFSM